MIVSNAEGAVAARVERALEEEPNIRMRRLEVLVEEDRIIVRGNVSSFYEKQMINVCFKRLKLLDAFLLENKANVIYPD